MDRKQIKFNQESDLIGQYDVEYEISNEFIPLSNQDVYSCENNCKSCKKKCEIGYNYLITVGGI